MERAVEIDLLGGNCPVQAEGSVNGRPFYFRARGNRWTFSVGDDPVGVSIGEPGEFHYEEAYRPGDQYAAGWMDHDEARAFIEKAAALYITKATTSSA